MRFFLLSIWLLPPLGGLLLLAADYQRFAHCAALESAACDALAQHLRSYSRALEQSAESLRVMNDLPRRDEWRRRWRRLTAEEEQEALRLTTGPLAPAPYVHYPRTQAALAAARASLLELEAEAEAALRAREQLVKARAGLADLEAQAHELALLSEHYRNIWTYGIYLELQERLGEAEERLREGNRACERLEDESYDRLEAVADRQREVEQGCSEAAAYMTEDGRVSYREALLARFNRFDLRAELRRLIATP